MQKTENQGNPSSTNDILIMAGSKGRPHLPLLKWIKDPVILVEPQEEAAYRATHPELDFVVLPENDRGFSYMMNQMVKTAIARGQRYFVFTDDDVFGFKSRGDLSQKFVRFKDEAVRLLLQGNLELMKEAGASQWCVSFSGQSWGSKVPFNEPVGAWGVYICDAWAVRAVGGFDENLWIFSDWEMSARLIQAGYRTVRTNLITFEHKMRGMGGGAAWLYENQAKVKNACEMIARKYGDAATIKWVEAHGQHEVRFNWKRLQNNHKKM